MPAAGKVCTGFSLPYVAIYTESSGTVTYSSGQKLARGVEVSMDITTGDNNIFYADNVAAEIVGGTFQEGTVTLTVDGLLDTSEKLIQGITSSTVSVGTATITVYSYDKNQSIPYVGIGYVARYLSAGVTTYVPCVVRKAKFQMPQHNASTEGENIEFQTQELTAALFRDDTANTIWFQFGADQATEAEAEAVVKELLDIT